MDKMWVSVPPADAHRSESCLPRQWTGEFTARSGLRFHVRPVSIEDEPALSMFFSRVTPEDLRYRFLTSVREVSRERLVEMTSVDHDLTENFVATDLEHADIIASAMLAVDATRKRGEVAIAIRSDLKRQGIGTVLMEHLCRYAEWRGLTCIEAIASRDNCALIELERRLGFTTRYVPDDPNLLLLQRTIP